jgi:hypothetical protein
MTYMVIPDLNTGKKLLKQINQTKNLCDSNQYLNSQKIFNKKKVSCLS